MLDPAALLGSVKSVISKNGSGSELIIWM